MDYVKDYKLDARPDRIDLRDRQYMPPLTSLEPEFPSSKIVEEFFPKYAEDHMVLDQGREGACTGFGLAAMINYLFWRREIEHIFEEDRNIMDFSPPPKVSTRMLYHLARFYDEWPGEDYEGSSCRGAVKAWHRHGVCEEEYWPYRDDNGKVKFIEPRKDWDRDAAKRPMGVYYRITKDSISDMQAAIQDVGAVYVSARVHEGWNLDNVQTTMKHENLPVIEWYKDIKRTGGHAFALVGYNKRGFVIQNSWGEFWGAKGFAVITYDDWLANGSDAWVCVLGAPQVESMPSHFIAPRDAMAKGRFAKLATVARTKGEHSYQDPKVKRWDVSEAYEHTVVMGNDGRVINRLIANENALATVNDIVVSKPAEFFNDTGSASIAIYAHGGLNDEESSIERIQTMAPYFKANGVYPLFFTWKTGFLDSLLNILEDSTARIFHRAEGLDDLIEDAKRKALDVLDRTLELACENLGVKAIWSQMKQNADEAAKSGDNDRGAFLLAAGLAKLREDFPELKIHLIGHSAGSILLGHMLDDFARHNLMVGSTTLYAPACSINFANRHYIKAAQKGIMNPDDLVIHTLSSQREIDDTVGPYQKSLLYLVSRALEESHKTPLLGMVDVFNPENNKNSWNKKTVSHLKKWQEFFMQHSENIRIIEREHVVTARKYEQNRELDLAVIDSAHGSFDNDVDVVDETLRRITGKAELDHKVENLRF